MVAAVVKGTVQRFCQSDAARCRRGSMFRIGGAPPLSPGGAFADTHRAVAALAERLWERMADPRESVPLGHDGYLKLWALSNPMIPADFILLDEAQDSNGVVIGLLSRQPAQVVLVGDRYQQIYEWRGAVNAMDRMKTKHHADLTQSFRFGPAIADAASRVLRVLGERKRIRGNEAYASVLHCEDSRRRPLPHERHRAHANHGGAGRRSPRGDRRRRRGLCSVFSTTSTGCKRDADRAAPRSSAIVAGARSCAPRIPRRAPICAAR